MKNTFGDISEDMTAVANHLYNAGTSLNHAAEVHVVNEQDQEIFKSWAQLLYTLSETYKKRSEERG